MDEDDMFKIFIFGAIIMTSVFVLCSCGIFCFIFCVARKHRSHPMHSTPVVVTSQSFQPVGSPSAYPVVVQTNSVNPSHNQNQESFLPTVQNNTFMPLPPNQTSFQTPYPPSGSTSTPFQPSPYDSSSSIPHAMHTQQDFNLSNALECPPTYKQAFETDTTHSQH